MLLQKDMQISMVCVLPPEAMLMAGGCAVNGGHTDVHDPKAMSESMVLLKLGAVLMYD